MDEHRTTAIGSVGGGLAADQRVATPSGWSAACDLQPGHNVVGADGKTGTVTAIADQGVQPVFRVALSDGTVVRCSAAQDWALLNPRRVLRTRPLQTVMERNLFTTNGPGTRQARHRVVPHRPLDLRERELPLHPYLIGYMLGNGSLSQSTPKIHCFDPEGEQHWRDVLPAGVHLSQYERRPGFCQQYGLVGDVWRSNPATDALRELALWGLSCSCKQAPEVYLWASQDQRLALLQGLLDSDGSAHASGGAEFSSTSEVLANQVVLVVQSLGGRARVYRKQACGSRRSSYRVYLSLTADVGAPFRLERKRDRWEPRKTEVARTIVAITEDGRKGVTAITTSCNDHTFLVDGMVPVRDSNYRNPANDALGDHHRSHP